MGLVGILAYQILQSNGCNVLGIDVDEKRCNELENKGYNIINKEFKVVYARSKNRFLGLEKEPRPGLRSGSIKNSFCLPFGDLINKDDKTFKDKSFIKKQKNNYGRGL